MVPGSWENQDRQGHVGFTVSSPRSMIATGRGGDIDAIVVLAFATRLPGLTVLKMKKKREPVNR